MKEENISRDLDKFYTHPEISKRFVENIKSHVSFDDMDIILEPSAGCGNISKCLPEDAVSIDLVPEGDGIIQQDFFDYFPVGLEPYDEENLFHKNYKKILTIGNPPFGRGYLNPLAVKFFNHAAKFSEYIAFIVPLKWTSSWKLHRQLNENFSCVYSEHLPKDSFLLDGKPYHVKCCQQLWKRGNHEPNLRILDRPKTVHEDFDLFLTCDNVKKRVSVRKQIKKNEYWDFGLKYWGKIGVCELNEIEENTTTHFLIKAHQPFVRKIFENIEWKKYTHNMGAENIGGKSNLIRAYEETKYNLLIQQWLELP